MNRRLYVYSDYLGNVRAERLMTEAMRVRVNKWLMRHNYSCRWVRFEIAEERRKEAA